MKDNKWLETLEGFGVGLRILGISVISILGADTPFAYIWGLQLVSAIILLWCAWKRFNRPYIILNGFYCLISIYGLWNSL